MKFLLSISFLLFPFFPSLFSQTLEELEKQMAAENNIRTKIQFDHKYIQGKASKTGTRTVVKVFSNKGDLLEKNSLNNKGAVIGWEKYAYDQAGNRTLYERENTSSKYKKESKYDVKNNLLLEAGFNGAENFRNEYKYSSTGKVKEISYSVGNRVEQKIVYQHNGNNAEVGIYAGGNTLTSKMKLKYDTKGNIIEETKLAIDNSEIEKKAYTYNASGKILKEEKTSQGNLIYRLTYIYNTRGNLLKISEETRSKKQYDKKIYTYDSTGKLTEFKWRRNPSDVFNMKSFTYDSRGICLTEYTLYPKTKYELLSKFEYEFY